MCPETMRIVLPVHQATKTEGRHSCPLPETSGLLTSVGGKSPKEERCFGGAQWQQYALQ